MGLKKSLAVISTAAILIGNTIFSPKVQAQGPNLNLKDSINTSINAPISLEERVRIGNFKNAKIVMIEPGHDKKYIGKNIGGVKEDSLNLELSKKLGRVLQREGYKVFLTRDSTLGLNRESLDLNNDKKVNVKDEIIARANYINSINPDYTIIIHHNANRSTKINGMELFFYGITNRKQLSDKIPNRNKPEECMEFSESSRALTEGLGQFIRNQGEKITVYGSDMKLLEYIPNNSIYLEMRYLTNPSDFKMITSPEWQDWISKIISDYFSALDKSSATDTTDSSIENRVYTRNINTLYITEDIRKRASHLRKPTMEYVQPIAQRKRIGIFTRA